MGEPPTQDARNPKKGFLNLPPEIRLPIYSELLHKPTAKLRIQSAKGAIDPSTLSIHSVLRHDPSASCEKYVCDGTEGWVHPPITVKRYAAHNDLPSSAILSTYRTIYTEAIPILYRANTLSFDCCPDSEEASTSAPQPDSDIFSYDPETWAKTPWSSSVFAAFLNAIGPVNARTITALCFSGLDAHGVASCLPTVTQLVADHVPGLHRLENYVEGHDIDPHDDWTPDWHHPNLSSPYYEFWRNKELWPLCRVLEAFVDRVTWLREFEYQWLMVYEDLWEDDRGGWRMLKGLEEVVRRRAEVENGDRRW